MTRNATRQKPNNDLKQKNTAALGDVLSVCYRSRVPALTALAFLCIRDTYQPFLRQTRGENRSSIGNISSLPKSMSSDRTIFDRSEKAA